MFLGGNGLLSWAERNVDSGVAALVVACIPVWLMLLEWISGRRKPPRVVVMTSDDAPDTLLKTVRRQAFTHVHKPLDAARPFAAVSAFG